MQCHERSCLAAVVLDIEADLVSSCSAIETDPLSSAPKAWGRVPAINHETSLPYIFCPNSIPEYYLISSPDCAGVRGLCAAPSAGPASAGCRE